MHSKQALARQAKKKAERHDWKARQAQKHINWLICQAPPEYQVQVLSKAYVSKILLTRHEPAAPWVTIPQMFTNTHDQERLFWAIHDTLNAIYPEELRVNDNKFRLYVGKK